MTPANWLFADLVVAGAAWMFGGLLLSLAVGVVVGWRARSFARGVGIGMLLWGLGNLVVAGAAASLAYHDTMRASLAVARCDLRGDDTKRFHQLTVHVPVVSGARELTLAWRDGPCPTEADARVMVRVRKDSLAGPGPVVGALDLDDEAGAIMAVWGVLGFIAVGVGWPVLAASRRGAAKASAAKGAQTPLPGWRKEIHEGLGLLGLGLLLAAFFGPMLMDGGVERSLSFAFRSAATAMACWFAGSAFAGRLTIGASAGWLTLGGLLLGVAEVMRLMT